MIKAIILFLILFIKNAFGCAESQMVKVCYLEYQLKYEKECWSRSLEISNYKRTYKKNKQDLRVIEKLTYKIKKKKKLSKSEDIHLCFYPANYWEMFCRREICGYSNKNKNIGESYQTL